MAMHQLWLCSSSTRQRKETSSTGLQNTLVPKKVRPIWLRDRQLYCRLAFFFFCEVIQLLRKISPLRLLIFPLSSRLSMLWRGPHKSVFDWFFQVWPCSWNSSNSNKRHFKSAPKCIQKWWVLDIVCHSHIPTKHIPYKSRTSVTFSLWPVDVSYMPASSWSSFEAATPLLRIVGSEG